MSTRRINFMPVLTNGVRSISIWWTTKNHAWNRMDSLWRKVSFNMVRQSNWSVQWPIKHCPIWYEENSWSLFLAPRSKASKHGIVVPTTYALFFLSIADRLFAKWIKTVSYSIPMNRSLNYTSVPSSSRVGHPLRATWCTYAWLQSVSLASR